MNNNPFLNSLKKHWSELKHLSYNNPIELISKIIASVIVIAVLFLLTPTIGLILSIYDTLNRMLKETYNKQKNTKDENSKFPIIIELAVYFVLWLPLFIFLVPYWAFSKFILFCANNLWVVIIIIAILVCIYFFRNNFIELIKGLGWIIRIS